ncbi:hypothetical protein MFLO_01170 [Listeria floridensis FSL S10-1187]|uniref:DUF1310 family protein n=1 Tax=Listeria floridensis FSL S10-1187 TaxID=1265817 RepID=A0ABP3B1J8_9LIST|nr:hypothetical protein MFLO_01170 [Listeria floridensis FSL S10-1187]
MNTVTVSGRFETKKHGRMSGDEVKKFWLIVLGIVVIIGLGIGVKYYMDKQEMLKVVKSEEAKKEYVDILRNLDKNALTDKGVIKTYKINDNSIKHNPMGGINVTLEINGSNNMILETTLNKYEEKIEAGGVSYSSDLNQLLKGGD